MNIYYRVVRLPPPRFANRRLQLPCIVFYVKTLAVKGFDKRGNCYCAKVSRLGIVEFTTADRLPLAEPHRLVFVHPWISHIRGSHPHGGVGVVVSDSEVDSEVEVGEDAGTDEEWVASPSGTSVPLLDDYTLALRMMVRLRQPFSALLLLRQPGGEYRRVAAEHESIVQVRSASHVRPRDIHAEVLHIL
ncbi:hypothetical protein EV363DRAFT_1180171 [Boletus edulis]|nr:hypothetical protein EV363DRAFT_1180171 [Boletus edulis]